MLQRWFPYGPAKKIEHPKAQKIGSYVPLGGNPDHIGGYRNTERTFANLEQKLGWSKETKQFYWKSIVQAHRTSMLKIIRNCLQKFFINTSFTLINIQTHHLQVCGFPEAVKSSAQKSQNQETLKSSLQREGVEHRNNVIFLHLG